MSKPGKLVAAGPPPHPAMGPRIRIVTYDHRGHGSSTCAPIRTYTIDQLADDLAAVITALDVQPPLTLVAHSMGAMAALTYLCRPASQRPIDPSGLVLVATAARKLGQRGLGRLLSTPATAALAHIAAHTPEHILHSLVAPLCVTLAPIRSHLPAATIAATALTALTTTATSTAIGYLPSLRSYDIYPGLPAIRARTVIISGGVDPLTPPQHAHELAAAIPNALHLHVPTAGHMLPQQVPNVVNHAIEQCSRAHAETEERQRISHQRGISREAPSPAYRRLTSRRRMNDYPQGAATMGGTAIFRGWRKIGPVSRGSRNRGPSRRHGWRGSGGVGRAQFGSGVAITEPPSFKPHALLAAAPR